MSSSNVWRYRSAFTFAVVVVIAVLSVPVAHAQQCGPMDVTFVIDNTGSMTDVIAQIQKQVNKIADAVTAASGGDYQFGLITSPANDVDVLLDMTPNNRTQLGDAVAKMVTSSSCALPAATDIALDTAVNNLKAAGHTWSAGKQNGDFSGTWRPGATKIIIIITDALPSGPDCDFNAGVDDTHAHTLAVRAAAIGIHISAVFVPTTSAQGSPSDIPTITAIMQDYATTSSGLYLQTKSDASDLGSIIDQIVSSCGGGLGGANTALVVDPTELFMGVGESADVSVTNFLPAGQGEVTTFTSDGLPSDSTVTFLTRTPDVVGTEARTMHITIGPDTPGGTYIVTVKASRDGMKDQFNFVLVFVDCVPPFILGKNQLGAKNVSPGSTTQLSVIPGGNGPFKYQWYRGHSGSIASPIAGATKSEFTTPAINSTSEFWVRVKNACGSRDSATAVVKPNP
jgi:hypothetical protein